MHSLESNDSINQRQHLSKRYKLIKWRSIFSAAAREDFMNKRKNYTNDIQTTKTILTTESDSFTARRRYGQKIVKKKKPLTTSIPALSTLNILSLNSSKIIYTNNDSGQKRYGSRIF